MLKKKSLCIGGVSHTIILIFYIFLNVTVVTEIFLYMFYSHSRQQVPIGTGDFFLETVVNISCFLFLISCSSWFSPLGVASH